MGGVFTKGEDTHTLRLTSELVDLRVEYAAYGYTDAVSSVMCRVRPTHSCTLARYASSVQHRPTVKINKRSEKTDRSFIVSNCTKGYKILMGSFYKMGSILTIGSYL